MVCTRGVYEPSQPCEGAGGSDGQVESEFPIFSLAAAGDLPSAMRLWEKYRQALVSRVFNPFHLLSNNELEHRAAINLIHLLETFPNQRRKYSTLHRQKANASWVKRFLAYSGNVQDG